MMTGTRIGVSEFGQYWW